MQRSCTLLPATVNLFADACVVDRLHAAHRLLAQGWKVGGLGVICGLCRVFCASDNG